MMHRKVIAVIVARNGAEYLPRTLDAVRNQTLAPDTILTIDCGSHDATPAILSSFTAGQYLTCAAKTSFGDAVTAAMQVVPFRDAQETLDAEPTEELVWLLAHDNAPEPEALEALVGAIETAPSVAIAGPKQMAWDDKTYIREFGEAITPLGATITLVDGELDQSQHDILSDVLGVGPAGLLIRRSVWEQLGGFDPGLPGVDNGLDLCIRARLAGHRVVLVPSAHVACDHGGRSPMRRRRTTSVRRSYRQRRAAQLHRRLVYSPAIAFVPHWLSILPLALLRSFLFALRKTPAKIPGEWAAAARAVFADPWVISARRRLAATRRIPWSSLESLRIPFAEARRRRAFVRESRCDPVLLERTSFHFLSAGGGWVVLASCVVSVGVLVVFLGATSLSGGALGPLSGDLGKLWSSAAYGFRDLGSGGAADPFAGVLALLGTFTFWSPSFALVLVYFLAIPLAALGAWLAACRVTERPGLRAFAALAWALAPTLLVSMGAGLPGAVLAHIFLPWLVFCACAAYRSWSLAAASAFLFAAVVACAPSLIPVLGLAWIVTLILSGRSVLRYALVGVPALVVFTPLVWDHIVRGDILAILADPGIPAVSSASSLWGLAWGFPGDGLTAASGLGAPFLGLDASGIVVVAFVVPLLLLALAGPFFAARAVIGLAVAAAGLLSATIVGSFAFAFSDGHAVSVWAGPSVSVYWLGLLASAVAGMAVMKKFAAIPSAAVGIALTVVAVPVVAPLLLGTSASHPGIGRELPASVVAEATAHGSVGTIIITPMAEGGITTHLERGAGDTVDQQSTLSATQASLSKSGERLASLSGNLASRGRFDASDELHALGVGFVIVGPSPAAADSLARDVEQRAISALDANEAFVAIGETAFGRLWRYVDATSPVEHPLPTVGAPHVVTPVLVVTTQLLVLGLVALLAFPSSSRRVGVWGWRVSPRRSKAARETLGSSRRSVRTRPSPSIESLPSRIDAVVADSLDTGTMPALDAPTEAAPQLGESVGALGTAPPKEGKADKNNPASLLLDMSPLLTSREGEFTNDETDLVGHVRSVSEHSEPHQSHDLHHDKRTDT